MFCTQLLALVFSCQILTSQTIARDASSLSSPVITRNHRRLKGSTFKSFHSVSLVSCGLQCQRHPRCVSTNFRKGSSLDEVDTGGVCELNERGAVPPIKENDLEHDEESIYAQFTNAKVSEDEVFLLSYLLFLQKQRICIYR